MCSFSGPGVFNYSQSKNRQSKAFCSNVSSDCMHSVLYLGGQSMDSRVCSVGYIISISLCYKKASVSEMLTHNCTNISHFVHFAFRVNNTNMDTN